jgi:transposase
MARATRQEWAERVARWQRSGLTAQAFAAEAELNAATLTYWKYRLRRDQRERAGKPGSKRRRSPARPTFVEATPALSTCTIASLEIVLRDDITVRVASGFDEDTLARVLRIVRTAP